MTSHTYNFENHIDKPTNKGWGHPYGVTPMLCTHGVPQARTIRVFFINIEHLLCFVATCSESSPAALASTHKHALPIDAPCRESDENLSAAVFVG